MHVFGVVFLSLESFNLSNVFPGRYTWLTKEVLEGGLQHAARKVLTVETTSMGMLETGLEQKAQSPPTPGITNKLLLTAFQKKAQVLPARRDTVRPVWGTCAWEIGWWPGKVSVWERWMPTMRPVGHGPLGLEATPVEQQRCLQYHYWNKGYGWQEALARAHKAWKQNTSKPRREQTKHTKPVMSKSPQRSCRLPMPRPRSRIRGRLPRQSRLGVQSRLPRPPRRSKSPAKAKRAIGIRGRLPRQSRLGVQSRLPRPRRL